MDIALNITTYIIISMALITGIIHGIKNIREFFDDVDKNMFWVFIIKIIFILFFCAYTIILTVIPFGILLEFTHSDIPILILSIVAIIFYLSYWKHLYKTNLESSITSFIKDDKKQFFYFVAGVLVTVFVGGMFLFIQYLIS